MPTKVSWLRTTCTIQFEGITESVYSNKHKCIHHTITHTAVSIHTLRSLSLFLSLSVCVCGIAVWLKLTSKFSRTLREGLCLVRFSLHVTSVFLELEPKALQKAWFFSGVLHRQQTEHKIQMSVSRPTTNCHGTETRPNFHLQKVTSKSRATMLVIQLVPVCCRGVALKQLFGLARPLAELKSRECK